MTLPLTVLKFYEGIDFDRQAVLPICALCDDGGSLSFDFDQPSQGIALSRAAIDAPFGTSAGFERILLGEVPADVGKDQFVSRGTERWLRQLVRNYETVSLWKSRTKSEKAAYKKTTLFNRTGHIRDALAMWTVPACIRYVGRRLCPAGSAEERLQRVQKARIGEAELVETHPRMFLYSALERNYVAAQGQPRSSWLNLLNAAAKYDKTPVHRMLLYDHLTSNKTWMGGAGPRAFNRVCSAGRLFDSPHNFNAWLAALAAWMHDHRETRPWSETGMPASMAAAEGHIHILR